LLIKADPIQIDCFANLAVCGGHAGWRALIIETNNVTLDEGCTTYGRNAWKYVMLSISTGHG
jgi:hypothetical protein